MSAHARSVDGYASAIRSAAEALADTWTAMFVPQLAALRESGGLLLVDGPSSHEIIEREIDHPILTMGAILSPADLERELVGGNEEWVMPQDGIGVPMGQRSLGVTWRDIGWPVVDPRTDEFEAVASEACRRVAGALTGMSDDDVETYRPAEEEIIVLSAARVVNAAVVVPDGVPAAMLLVILLTDNVGDTEELAVQALNGEQRAWIDGLFDRRGWS